MHLIRAACNQDHYPDLLHWEILTVVSSQILEKSNNTFGKEYKKEKMIEFKKSGWESEFYFSVWVTEGLSINWPT